MTPDLWGGGNTGFQIPVGDAAYSWPGFLELMFFFVTGVLTFTLCLLQLLTNHYEQNWKYYCLPSGWGSYGTASEDELLLTKKLFWGIFDSLSQRVSTGASPSLHFTLIDALVTYTVAVKKE